MSLGSTSCLADAGLEDRVRGELFKGNGGQTSVVGSNPRAMRYYMDGWWPVLGQSPTYLHSSTWTAIRDRPEIDNGLLHELLHQLGVIEPVSNVHRTR